MQHCRGGVGPDTADLVGAMANWVEGDVRILLHTGLNADTDGDGVPDDSDNCVRKSNPDQQDIDRDGFGDLCDNCPAVYNPDQGDSNGNAIGDACEQTIVEVRISFNSGFGRGSGTVTWRTTHEYSLTGFNIVTYDNSGHRIQLNTTKIPCEQCVTGEGVSYTFVIPKHRNGRDVFIEGVCPEDCSGPYGPAVTEKRN